MLQLSSYKQLKTKTVLFAATTFFFLIFSHNLSMAETQGMAGISRVSNPAGESGLEQELPVKPETSASLAVQPGRYYVDGTADASGDGSSWATAFKTIREAVAAAVASSEIWVKAGTYFVNAEPGGSPGGIVLDKMLYLFGGFTGREASTDERVLGYNATILDAEQKDRCFLITKNVYLDGFTMTNGLANMYNDSDGGAIKLTDCSPALRHCVFLSNKMTGRGGAIYIEYGSPYLQDCLFQGNGSKTNAFGLGGWAGGAIFVEHGYPALVACTFKGNSVLDGSGGAIYGAANIERCLFESNSCSWSSGGAIYGGGSADSWQPLTIQHSTFILNTASYAGGAVYGCGNIIDCRFDHNLSSDGGAAITVCSATASKTNIADCVFTNNAAINYFQYLSAGGGGAICTHKQTDTYVFNSLFVKNSAGKDFPLNGAAYTNGGNSYILNCTFWDNTINTIDPYTGRKYSEGGTIYNQPGQSLKVANSILWNNHGSPVEIGGEPAAVSYCDLVQENLAGINNNIQIDPGFIDPLQGNFHLRPDSPCSYAGSNLNALPLTLVSEETWNWVLRCFL